ncbi:hypothetical protein ACSFA2_25190 [Variovorax sp. LT2P21]|uniref:hypothetical protein n=1 Tax=Variovorax sp. LT2P21 TaxID=3443731 RepID=UPI003F4557A5
MTSNTPHRAATAALADPQTPNATKAVDPRFQILFPRASAAARLETSQHLVAEELDDRIKADPENADRSAWELARELLTNAAENLKAQAMGLLGAESAEAMKQLREVTAEVDRSVSQIKQAQRVLEIGTALLAVVGSFTAGAPLQAIASLTALGKLLAEANGAPPTAGAPAAATT